MLLLFIYLWLHWVFFAACGLSLAAVSRGLLFIVVLGLLTVVASLVVEHGLQGVQSPAFVAQGVSCPRAHGIFLDQGSNPYPLH